MVRVVIVGSECDEQIYHFIVTARHLLLKNAWFTVGEFDGTNEDCLKYMKGKNINDFNIIKGDFVKFRYKTETKEDVKEKIFKKHSQGGVFDEKQDVQNFV